MPVNKNDRTKIFTSGDRQGDPRRHGVPGLALLLDERCFFAQQLPVRTYTTADGLPRDVVLRIVRDSRGFLWFCTGDGLSRFNGYEFTTYSIEQGLPHSFINDLLETRRGTYWVA